MVTTLECTECGDEWRDVQVAEDGTIVPPEELTWVSMGCNWGDGKTLVLVCAECLPHYANNPKPAFTRTDRRHDQLQ